MFEPFADHSQQPLMRPFSSMNEEERQEDSLFDKDEMDDEQDTSSSGMYLSSSPCCSVDNVDPILVSPSTATSKDVILFDQDMMEDWWESNSVHEDTTLEMSMKSEVQEDNASHQVGAEDGSTHIAKPSTTREDLMTSYLEHVLLEIKNMNIPFVCGDIWAPPETNERYITEDQALLVDYPLLYRYCTIAMKGIPKTISTDIVERPSELTRSFLLWLVGRVYSSKTATVEMDMHEMVGVNMLNVKSIVGIPVHNTRFGSFVVLFYGLDEIKLDKRLLDKVKHICERVNFDESDNVYVVKGKNVSATSSALFSTDEIQELVTLLSKHIPADDFKAESCPDFFASIQAFISLRIILLRPESSYTDDEKAYLQKIKQSWFSYLKNSMLDEKDIANRLVREWMFLNKCNISPTSIW